MKTKLKLSVACGIAALLVGFNVQAEEKTFSIGGDVELDLTAKDTDASGSSYYNGGRIKLNATGEMKGENGSFVKGVAQPLVPFKGDALGYDDVYLQFGRPAWDVQIGRFEALDLFPAGKDTVVEHAAGMSHYGTNDSRGRKSNVIHTALHLKPNDATTFELGVMGTKNTSDYDKFTAIRPAISYKAGMATLRAGIESVKSDEAGNAAKEVSHTGFGLSGGFDLAGGSLNVNLAKKNYKKDAGADKTTYGVNYTQGPWGVGYIGAKEDYSSIDAKLNTFYAAYSIPLMGLKDATVTFAASTSKATDVGGTKGNDDNVNAFRTRFNYAF